MSLILGKAVPAQGKPDLSEKAERAFRVARERREEEVRAELREKIAAGVEGAGCQKLRRCGYEPVVELVESASGATSGVVPRTTGMREIHDPGCPDAIAARIRAGEFG